MPPAPAPRRQIPYVGRQQELTAPRASLERALSGHGQLILLAGEPGIGKTQTAEEVVSLATPNCL